MELNVSLDNITLTAYIKPKKFLALKHLVETHTALVMQTSMTDMFRAYTKAGDQVRLLIDYDKLKGQAFNARPFRMEFNPNKLRDIDSHLLDIIIPFLEDISITRVDLAFDLFEVDCSDFILEKKGRPTSTKEFRSSTGKLETKYLGAAKSEKQVRLYNKKLEQLENGSQEEKERAKEFTHWWRLEFQLRTRSVENIFEIVDTIIFKPRKLDSLSLENKIYLTALLHDRAIWNELHRNTRVRYKKILEELPLGEVDYLTQMRDLLKQRQPIFEKQLAHYGGR